MAKSKNRAKNEFNLARKKRDVNLKRKINDVNVLVDKLLVKFDDNATINVGDAYAGLYSTYLVVGVEKIPMKDALAHKFAGMLLQSMYAHFIRLVDIVKTINAIGIKQLRNIPSYQTLMNKELCLVKCYVTCNEKSSIRTMSGNDYWRITASVRHRGVIAPIKVKLNS